jgi:hypothetical protein
MKTLLIIARNIFFFGSFAIAALAMLEKIMHVFRFTLFRGYFYPLHLLELSAIGILFSIAIQIYEIRLALNAKSSILSK